MFGGGAQQANSANASKEEAIALSIKPDNASGKEKLVWVNGMSCGNQTLDEKKEFMAQVVEGLAKAKSASDVYLTEIIESKKVKGGQQSNATTQDAQMTQ